LKSSPPWDLHNASISYKGHNYPISKLASNSVLDAEQVASWNGHCFLVAKPNAREGGVLMEPVVIHQP
jgi:hypothetical protein